LACQPLHYEKTRASGGPVFGVQVKNRAYASGHVALAPDGAIVEPRGKVGAELSQPLAAIRTFVASSSKYAERGDSAQVRDNLATVAGLTERMAAITAQLKTFARKSDGRQQPVDLRRCLDHALLLLDGPLR